MKDRKIMQQALDALTYKKWWRVGLGEPKDPKLEAAITSLNERLAHCDRCGKKMGGEGDIHTCTPPAAPVQEPVAWMHTMIADVVIGHCPADLNHLERWKPLYTTPPAAQRQHVTDGSLCWCEPETSYTDPETGASVVVHKGPQ
jgi:hypothetical protein